MDYTFNDFVSAAEHCLKSGVSLSQFTPDGKVVEQDANEDFRRVLAIIRSMTNDEREYPEQIHPNRARRIALGSGTDPQEVDELVRQFLEMRRFMSRMQKTRAKGADNPHVRSTVLFERKIWPLK